MCYSCPRAARSPAIDVSLIPERLADLEQWICWQETECDGKATKVPIKPYHTNGTPNASATEAGHWRDLESALAFHESDRVRTDGIGFVFVANSPGYVYAGQYPPEAMGVLRAAEPPAYVAVVGKLRIYERGDRTNVAIEPDSITEVDEATRDAWVAETASQTRERLEAFEKELAPFGGRSREVYGDDVRTLFEFVDSLDGEIAE